MIFEVCKNQQKKTKVRHLGSQRFNSCAALRDRRGPAEALELCKNLKVLFDTLCPPERGRRIQGASAHSAGPVYGFVSLWCVGLISFSFCDQILCEKPTCENRFQILLIYCNIQPGASKKLPKWSQKGPYFHI